MIKIPTTGDALLVGETVDSSSDDGAGFSDPDAHLEEPEIPQVRVTYKRMPVSASLVSANDASRTRFGPLPISRRNREQFGRC